MYGQATVPALSKTRIHLPQPNYAEIEGYTTKGRPGGLPQLARDPPLLFYGAFVPSRPYRSFNLTTSSRCGVDASSTSQSVTASI